MGGGGEEDLSLKVVYNLLSSHNRHLYDIGGMREHLERKALTVTVAGPKSPRLGWGIKAGSLATTPNWLELSSKV